MSKSDAVQLLKFSARCMAARTSSDFLELSGDIKRLLPIESVFGGLCRVGADAPPSRITPSVCDQPFADLLYAKPGRAIPADPVCALALRSQKPFYWSQARQSADADVAAFMRRADSHGLGRSLSYIYRPETARIASVIVLSGPVVIASGPLAFQIEYALAFASRAHIACMGGKYAADAWNLTCREVEILECALRGMTITAIAGALDISERTVKFHIDNAVTKLGAQNRCQAIGIAVAQGMIKCR